MLQRRYDDKMKRRVIKRVVVKGTPKKQKKEKQKEVTLVVDEENTKITQASANTSSSTTSLTSSSADIQDLKKLGHHNIPDCPSTWTNEEGMDYYEINVETDSKEFKWAADMLVKTMCSYHLNNSSNHKVTFSKLELTRLVRIQNPALWLR